jgi:O-antigen ligase/polysaccharide polymerase Wzy-like membrane protein
MAIGKNGSAIAADVLPGRRTFLKAADPTRTAYFWLFCFFIVYCTRFQDFLTFRGAVYIPWAKFPAIMAILGLASMLGKTKRTFKDLPKMTRYLLGMTILMYIGAFLSPIWKGGALKHTIDFSKILVIWVLIFLIITEFERLRRIIFVQTFSVVIVGIVAIIKGLDVPRLNQVLGGFYGNPNDLAFAFVLSLPYAMAFLVTTKNRFMKVYWVFGMLVMVTVIFLTASRAGFIDLVCAYSVMLYYYGIKGKRYHLIVATAVLGGVIGLTVGGKLYDRFNAMSGDTALERSAYGSMEARKYLMERALEGIKEYPLFGLGNHNFYTYSGDWHEVHMTYLQVGVECGIPALIFYLMFFYRDFQNMFELRRMKLDPEVRAFSEALTGTQVGFVVGALFAPEAYQFFPYFAAAFTVTLLQTAREQQQVSGPVSPPPKKARHFLEVYANRRGADAVTPVR